MSYRTYSPWSTPSSTPKDPPTDFSELRTSSSTMSSHTFGPGTLKPRRPPPSVPVSFHDAEPAQTHTRQTSSSSVSTVSSCCSCSCERRDHSPYAQTLTLKAHYNDNDAAAEPMGTLSPRPANKRNSVDRPGLKGNTRTSFTADGDRVEEYNGHGSLRIGTHWADEEDDTAAQPTTMGLGVRRDSTRGGW